MKKVVHLFVFLIIVILTNISTLKLDIHQVNNIVQNPEANMIVNNFVSDTRVGNRNKNRNNLFLRKFLITFQFIFKIKIFIK